MEQKNQAVAARFAENLVGTMLQRSGADFFQPQSGEGTADFLVRNGDMLVAIEVKYLADLRNVEKVWETWLSRMHDKAPKGSKSEKSTTAQNGFHSLRLVIVAGTGETVFTDSATAQLLRTDQRTSLSIVSPSAKRQKRLTTVGEK